MREREKVRGGGEERVRLKRLMLLHCYGRLHSRKIDPLPSEKEIYEAGT